jgi:hypothetical protein
VQTAHSLAILSPFSPPSGYNGVPNRKEPLLPPLALGSGLWVGVYRGISTSIVTVPPHLMHEWCPALLHPTFHVPRILSRAQPEIYCVCHSEYF